MNNENEFTGNISDDFDMNDFDDQVFNDYFNELNGEDNYIISDDDYIVNEDYNICPNCKIPFSLAGNYKYECLDCGIVEEITGGYEESQTNKSASSYMGTIGKNGQVKHYFVNAEKNDDFCIKQIMTEYNKYNNIKNKLPKKVIRDAAMIFFKIKNNNKILRSRVKKRAMAAALFHACKMNKISRSENEISNIIGIYGGFSFGNSKLIELQNMGELEPNDDLYGISDFVKRFLELLDIDNNDHETLAIEMTEFANNMNICNNCRIKSKVIGVIYVCIKGFGIYDKNNKDIQESCDINPNTFKKFIKAFERHHTLFDEILEKYPNFDKNNLLKK